jgi:hypothetical protein
MTAKSASDGMGSGSGSIGVVFTDARFGRDACRSRNSLRFSAFKSAIRPALIALASAVFSSDTVREALSDNTGDGDEIERGGNVVGGNFGSAGSGFISILGSIFAVWGGGIGVDADADADVGDGSVIFTLAFALISALNSSRVFFLVCGGLPFSFFLSFFVLSAIIVYLACVLISFSCHYCTLYITS